MTLDEKRKQLKLTYRKIAKISGITSAGVFRIINQPWRTTLNSFMKMAKILGANENDAKKEWSDSKLTHYNDKITKEVE